MSYLDALGLREINKLPARTAICGLVQGIGEMHLLGIPRGSGLSAGSIIRESWLELRYYSTEMTANNYT
jgi:hypothetical protein